LLACAEVIVWPGWMTTVLPTTDRTLSVRAVVMTPDTVTRMAVRPNVAAGFRRAEPTAPLRMSPRASGRSGMPPGAGAELPPPG